MYDVSDIWVYCLSFQPTYLIGNSFSKSCGATVFWQAIEFYICICGFLCNLAYKSSSVDCCFGPVEVFQLSPSSPAVCKAAIGGGQSPSILSGERKFCRRMLQCTHRSFSPSWAGDSSWSSEATSWFSFSREYSGGVTSSQWMKSNHGSTFFFPEMLTNCWQFCNFGSILDIHFDLDTDFPVYEKYHRIGVIESRREKLWLHLYAWSLLARKIQISYQPPRGCKAVVPFRLQRLTTSCL